MGVTIHDVAKAARTSVSTVSKVINGYYSISDETAARVRQVMKELNYTPSTSAQNFARGTTKCVVMLANLAPGTAFRNPHLFEIASGLEEALRLRGYRLILRGADATTAYEAAEEIISRRSADAIAIHVSMMNHPLSALLTNPRFPHIVLGMPNFESQVCWIDNNNVYSGTVAASYLLAKGYRRIAFVGGQYYDLGSTHRLQGLRQGLRDAGATLGDQYIWLGESTREDGYRMTKQLLGERSLPEAVVCANNYIALGCVAAIQEQGLDIPKDIGVLAFDDYPFSQFTQPKLTVVNIDVRDLGNQAGRFLIDIIRHPNKQVQTYVTTSILMERQSIRKIGK